jgi:hypothetical protein
VKTDHTVAEIKGKLERDRLAANGGRPVRTEPLPLGFPGIHYLDEEEINAAVRVLRSRSFFRLYGLELGEAQLLARTQKALKQPPLRRGGFIPPRRMAA